MDNVSNLLTGLPKGEAGKNQLKIVQILINSTDTFSSQIVSDKGN